MTRQLPLCGTITARKGLVSNRGQRKLAFYSLQKFYKKLPMRGSRAVLLEIHRRSTALSTGNIAIGR